MLFPVHLISMFPLDFYRMYKSLSLCRAFTQESFIQAYLSTKIFWSALVAHFHVALRLFFIISWRASFTFGKKAPPRVFFILIIYIWWRTTVLLDFGQSFSSLIENWIGMFIF